MSEQSNLALGSQSGGAIETIQQTLENFLETANVERVYGEPVSHGDITILPAAEVLVAVGFGAGSGAGPDPESSQMGGGGGGGGGGRTLSRPVAVVVATSNSVHVEPVIDLTKMVMAGITAAGFMLVTMLRMSGRGRALPPVDTG